MYQPTLSLASFQGAENAPRLAKLLEPLVEWLAGVDYDWMQTHQVPPLYSSGLVYSTAHETCPGCFEVWRDIPELLKTGVGNCKDFTAWRLAEYWRMGVRAKAYVTPSVDRQGSVLYHVQLQLPDGRIEDPSIAMGMGLTG